MNQPVSALVVNDDVSLLQELQAVLEGQAVRAQCARSCQEAKAALSLEEPPDIIFAGTTFADGTWRDVLNMAHKSSPRVGVIVTTRLADMRLYLDAMEEGAADYIVPPFVARDVARVVRSAIQDLRRGYFAVQQRGAA